MEPSQTPDITYDHRKVTCWYITVLCCVAGTFGFVGTLTLLSVYKLSSMAPILIVTTPCVAFVTVFTCVRLLAPSKLSKVYHKLLSKRQPLETPLQQQSSPSLSSLDFKINLSCPICFSTLADEVCIPCGHVFCQGCLNDLHSQCAICREEIIMTQKMYL